MGKRKNKKGKKRGFFGLLGSLLSFLAGVSFRVIPFALVVAAFLFGAFGVWKVLLADTHLKVSEIRVNPADVLTSQNIKVLEDKWIGKNILAVGLKEVASQIELGPGAKSVRVVREIPSTLRIDIVKRKPAVNVLLKPGGPYAVASDDGVVIAVSPVFEPAWVLIEDFSEPVKEPRIGSRILNKGFFEALKFLKAFERHELSRKEKITKISLDPYGNVAVRLGEGPDFLMGRRPTEKFAQLSKAMYLFKTEPRENFEYVDLQYDRVVGNPRKQT